jgi:hypothetical protein
MIQQIKSNGFSDLETAILKKEKTEREIVRQREKGSPEQLGRKTAQELQEAELRKKTGELLPAEKVTLLTNEFGIAGALAKNISSLYSAQDIRAGKPFLTNPEYVNNSTLGKQVLTQKLREMGIDIMASLRVTLQNKVQALDIPATKKQSLVNIILEDQSEGLQDSQTAILNIENS